MSDYIDSKIIPSMGSDFVVIKDKDYDKREDIPGGLFGHTVIIKSNGIEVNNQECDMEFSVPFDCDFTPNEATIKIYNLSDVSAERFKRNELITITAGYKEDVGIVFSGYISKIRTKVSGVERITTINAIDGDSLDDRDLQEATFAKGSTSAGILKALLEVTGLPVAIFSCKNIVTYKNAVKVDGSLIDLIEKYANECKTNVYISRGKIYVNDIRESGTDVLVTANVGGGLISEPEEFEEVIKKDDYKDTLYGYKLDLLLYHQIEAGARITLDSINGSGAYVVRKGEHKYDGFDLKTYVEVIK
ncbi:MAG: hypothetical protein MJ230_01555 [bacterium]|nr:hypothetical protein [bacterium]